MHEEILSYTHPMLIRIQTVTRLDPQGFQVVFRFRSGYGGSVVQHAHSYGGTEGRYELAVARWNSADDDSWIICYDTPITDDVLGHLAPADVYAVLDRLGELAPDAQALAGALLDEDLGPDGPKMKSKII